MTISWEEFSIEVGAYLSTYGGDNWRGLFVPLLESVIGEGGRYWASTFGLQFDVENLLAEDWWTTYQLQFAQPITDTTRNALTDLFAQATREGWSLDTTRNRLGQVFRQWMAGDQTPEDFAWTTERMPPFRRDNIARTESMRALNSGSYALFEQWQVGEHEWLATLDERTRPTHAAASGQVRRLGEPFLVGGALLLHPHDMSLGAPINEVAGCRCIALPIIPRAGAPTAVAA